MNANDDHTAGPATGPTTRSVSAVCGPVERRRASREFTPDETGLPIEALRALDDADVAREAGRAVTPLDLRSG